MPKEFPLTTGPGRSSLKKNAGLVLFLLFLVPAVAASQDYTLEIEGRYWRPQLNSVVDMFDDVIKSRVDLVKDLGFDEKKDAGEVRLQVRFSEKHKVNFSYLPLEWNADAILQGTSQFDGQTYTFGTRVQSHLGLKFIKLGYEWDFLAGKTGFLGATFDLLVLDLHMRIKEPEFSMEQNYDITFPAPLLGMTGRWNIAGWLSLGGKISGMYGGGYGFVLDSEGSLDLSPVKWAVVSAGYRYLELKGGYQNYQGDYRLYGPFVALKFRI